MHTQPRPLQGRARPNPHPRARKSSLPIHISEEAKGGVAPGPETRSDSPNRLITNKPKAQLPAEKNGPHFSGPEATADLGGHSPAMCHDMAGSLRAEPPHSVLARHPSTGVGSGRLHHLPPLWGQNKSVPSSLNPSQPKTTSRTFVLRRSSHIRRSAHDLRTTDKPK